METLICHKTSKFANYKTLPPPTSLRIYRTWDRREVAKPAHIGYRFSRDVAGVHIGDLTAQRPPDDLTTKERVRYRFVDSA